MGPATGPRALILLPLMPYERDQGIRAIACSELLPATAGGCPDAAGAVPWRRRRVLSGALTASSRCGAVVCLRGAAAVGKATGRSRPDALAGGVVRLAGTHMF